MFRANSSGPRKMFLPGAQLLEALSMYKSCFIMLGLSAVAMLLAMYAMIASLAHFVFKLNVVFMTGLIVTPMAVIMLLFLLHMYNDKPSCRHRTSIRYSGGWPADRMDHNPLMAPQGARR